MGNPSSLSFLDVIQPQILCKKLGEGSCGHAIIVDRQYHHLIGMYTCPRFSPSFQDIILPFLMLKFFGKDQCTYILIVDLPSQGTKM